MTPFRVIVADPPWKHNDKLGKRGAQAKYPCMKTEAICNLELPPIADDALLFLWRLSNMPEDALVVAHMWGFTPKSEITWIKTRKGVVITDDDEVDESDCKFGQGRYVRNCHETAIICGRGKAASMIKNHSIRSVMFAELGEHSAKPEAFYDLVERLSGGEGPYLELFARRQRAGWTCIGDKLGTTLVSL